MQGCQKAQVASDIASYNLLVKRLNVGQNDIIDPWVPSTFLHAPST